MPLRGRVGPGRVSWNEFTWDTARAAGLVAYGLLSLSVLMGLVLSQGWRTATLSRFVTTELHRFITLVALMFTAIHGIALLLDPFMRFPLPELLVPLVSHYRPIWIGLGIVGAYLLLALWLSEWLRPWIGYRWWRRFHVLAFLVYGLATIHGLATGTDTRTAWGLEIYALSVLFILLLLLSRLLWPTRGHRRPGLAVLAAGLAVAAALLAVAGPLQSGWNQIANGGNGSGSRLATQAGGDIGAPVIVAGP